jgi:isopenicillin N synthase-like dioxygenase
MTIQQIPIIDISNLQQSESAVAVAKQISEACREHGFFYVSGHGVSIELQKSIEKLSAEFFALPAEEKKQIAMHKGGRAWRGFLLLMRS